MNKEPVRDFKIVRNMVIALLMGAFVGIFLAAVVNNLIGGIIPGRVIGSIAGASIGVSFVLLTWRQVRRRPPGNPCSLDEASS
jgi:hypothetical protein